MMSSQKNKISQCTFCLFQILILLNRLKIADARAEYGEMNITKLNQRIDNIEDDIIRAKVGRFFKHTVNLFDSVSK